MATQMSARTASGKRRRQASAAVASGTTTALTARGPRHWSNAENWSTKNVSANANVASTTASTTSPSGAWSTVRRRRRFNQDITGGL